MKRISRLIRRHLEGDAKPALSLPTLADTFHLERTDETLTAYGGLAAYSAFVKKLGWIADLAARAFPSNAPAPTPCRCSFELNCLCEGRRIKCRAWRRWRG